MENNKLDQAIETIKKNHPHGAKIMLSGACDTAIAAMEELQVLRQKLGDGRLVECPCKVGDTVYEVALHYGKTENVPEYKIRSWEVEMLIIGHQYGDIQPAYSVAYEPPEIYTFTPGMQDSVYLTREEAEAEMHRLQRLSRKGD